MLHRFANAKRGERVVFHLAASGIGTSQLKLKRLAELVGYGSVFRWKYEIVPDLVEMNKFAWKDLITLIEMQRDGLEFIIDITQQMRPIEPDISPPII